MRARGGAYAEELERQRFGHKGGWVENMSTVFWVGVFWVGVCIYSTQWRLLDILCAGVCLCARTIRQLRGSTKTQIHGSLRANMDGYRCTNFLPFRHGCMHWCTYQVHLLVRMHVFPAYVHTERRFRRICSIFFVCMSLYVTIIIICVHKLSCSSCCILLFWMYSCSQLMTN